MSTSLPDRTIRIDMRGQICPSTLLVAMDNLNRHARELQGGSACLLILTDNREALHTIPATAESMGYATQISNPGDHYELLIGLAGQEP